MTWSGTKAIVLHQDDVGMCHGANRAYDELTRFGACSSGSVMVPCPWFSEAAEIARELPEADMGVHLTLTAEKEHYRWRPLTGASQTGNLWPLIIVVQTYQDRRQAFKRGVLLLPNTFLVFLGAGDRLLCCDIKRQKNSGRSN